MLRIREVSPNRDQPDVIWAPGLTFSKIVVYDLYDHRTFPCRPGESIV